MRIKVCGMKDAKNMETVGRLPIDYMGFIFYAPSPRYAGGLDPEEIRLPRHIQRTGVFVDELPEVMLSLAQCYQLSVVQLHGNESTVICDVLRREGLQVIKVFSVNDVADLQATASYEGHADFFLFDTKTSLRGGSGRQFDWSVLQYYEGQTPFFLSGGIGADDVERIRQFEHPLLYALDLNSCFESSPGIKDVDLLAHGLHGLFRAF